MGGWEEHVVGVHGALGCRGTFVFERSPLGGEAMMNPSGAVEQHLKQLSIICFAIAGLAILAMALAWPRVDQLQDF